MKAELRMKRFLRNWRKIGLSFFLPFLLFSHAYFEAFLICACFFNI